MLQKLLLLANEGASAYRENVGGLTKDPIVTEERSFPKESYDELIALEEVWEEYVKGDSSLPKVPGVAVANHNAPYHMLFVGTFQISLIFNDSQVLRGGDTFEPYTLAKITIYDYSLHPERIMEYFTKNTSTWSMEQFTLGFGLGYLQQTLKVVADKQPPAPETPAPTVDKLRRK